MTHTVIPPPRCTAATLDLTHKGHINDKTIPERDGEVRDFNVTLLASAIARRRHLVIDTGPILESRDNDATTSMR